MHALVINRGETMGSPEGHQVHGFAMHRRALREALGMTFEMATTESLEDVANAVRRAHADVAFVMVSWKEQPERVVELFRDLSQAHDRPRIVFLDYYAPASSPHFGVLPFVDAYLKRQVYRNRSLYHRDHDGGNLFTDYVSNRMGIELHGWDFSSTPDPLHMHKLVHGWNLGVTPRYRRLLNLTRAMPLPWEYRPFAVNCRLGCTPGPTASAEWYHRYRQRWAEALAPLRSERLCTGSGRIRPRCYSAEMLLSRIGVSPFGWGEVCFRDYEVIASGALLVKPSMAHLKTCPDIFAEGKTYVAASWDGGDVADICRHYLAHPEQAKEVIRDGQQALAAYFADDGFVRDVDRVLDVAGIGVGVSNVPARAIPSLV